MPEEEKAFKILKYIIIIIISNVTSYVIINILYKENNTEKCS